MKFKKLIATICTMALLLPFAPNIRAVDGDGVPQALLLGVYYGAGTADDELTVDEATNAGVCSLGFKLLGLDITHVKKNNKFRFGRLTNAFLSANENFYPGKGAKSIYDSNFGEIDSKQKLTNKAGKCLGLTFSGTSEDTMTLEGLGCKYAEKVQDIVQDAEDQGAFDCVCIALSMQREAWVNKTKAKTLIKEIGRETLEGKSIVIVGTEYGKRNNCGQDDLREIAETLNKMEECKGQVCNEVKITDAGSGRGVEEFKEFLVKHVYSKIEVRDDVPPADGAGGLTGVAPLANGTTSVDKKTPENTKGNGVKIVGGVIAGVGVLAGAAVAVKKLILDKRASSTSKNS